MPSVAMRYNKRCATVEDAAARNSLGKEGVMSTSLSASALVRERIAGGQLRFGEPKTVRALTIAPVFAHTPAGERRYRLASEAGARVRLLESGKVHRIRLENPSAHAVLLLEGDHLVGGRQNRTVNTTVMVGADAVVDVPVSCVEARRWSPSRQDFLADFLVEIPLSPELRGPKSASVTRQDHGFASDQSLVWNAVAEKLSMLGARSDTEAVRAAYQARRDDLDAYTAEFQWQDGQVGVACGIAGRVVCYDIFDHPETMRAAFPRLLRSYALDAVLRPQAAVDRSAFEERFLEAAEARMEERPGVALGTDVRIVGPSIEGFALVLEGLVIHLALFVLP